MPVPFEQDRDSEGMPTGRLPRAQTSCTSTPAAEMRATS